ncbi:MAG: ROK family protein [Christensenellales bacterium]|jgi:glucokinase
MKKHVIGIDVGGTKILYGVFDEHMNLLRVIQRSTDPELKPDQLMDQITGHVSELLRGAGIKREEVRGIGAAFPSHIDFERGIVLETSNIVMLNNVPVRALLEERLGLPVWLDNDANVAALAEHRLGAGRGHRDMIYVTVSTGIGGGLILNGDLYRGIHGAAGEIGHMFISDAAGSPCGCGVTGCVQSIASGPHMAEYAMNRIKEGEESSILKYAGTFSRIDMVAVGRAFQEDDPLAVEVVARGAEYLGRMFHSLYQIFDINVFVYGGGVMKLGPRFIEMIVSSYKRYSQMEARYPAHFLAAELGDNTGMIGAALLVP